VAQAAGYAQSAAFNSQSLLLLLRRLAPNAPEETVAKLASQIVDWESRRSAAVTAGLLADRSLSKYGIKPGMTSAEVDAKLADFAWNDAGWSRSYYSFVAHLEARAAMRFTLVLAHICPEQGLSPQETTQLVAYGLVRFGHHNQRQSAQEAIAILTERFPTIEVSQFISTEADKYSILTSKPRALAESPVEMELYGKLSRSR